MKPRNKTESKYHYLVRESETFSKFKRMSRYTRWIKRQLRRTSRRFNKQIEDS